MKSKQKELANVINEIDITQHRPSFSQSLSSSNNAFADVTSFLNIDTKPTTLFELKKEFTTHNLYDDDGKLDDNNYREINTDSGDELDQEAMYEKEQFLTFIHSGDTNLSDNNSPSLSPKVAKQYSLSVLSKNIIDPYGHSLVSPLSLDENKEYDAENLPNDDPNLLNLNISSDPDNLQTATSVPINVFADSKFVCNENKQKINWKFGFVTSNAEWRPEFIDVIKIKQFNFKKAANIFRCGSSFKKPKSHERWKNIYWMFDNRSQITKENQKNAKSGMKQYLNDYHDGIILKYNYKYNISDYDKNKCLDLIGSDDAIEKPITFGILRAYCHCDVVEWKNEININALITNNQKIKCISCNQEYEEQDDDINGDKKIKEEEEKEKEEEDINNDHCYWIQGIAKKHNNLKVYLCGKCIISLIIEGTDRDQIDIYQYLTDCLKNNRKITELCLVHRLFATSSQLMQLLINSFCKYFEESDVSGMVKVINFVIKWVNFLWFEDFIKTSRCRLLLNKFISFLLEQTNGKSQYGAIWKATQKLLAHYRDQYLLQQQIDSVLEANILNDTKGRLSKNGKINKMSSMSPNISSKVQLENLNNMFSDDEDSEEMANSDNHSFFQHDLFSQTTDNNNNNQKLIPSDLSWYETNKDENKQKFFHYMLQKRNSIDQFRKYQSKEVKTIKKTKSLNVSMLDPNDVQSLSTSNIHKSMPFKSVKRNKNDNHHHHNKIKRSRESSKSIHLNKKDLKKKNNHHHHLKNNHNKRKVHGSDSLNVIKSYDIVQKQSKSGFAILGRGVGGGGGGHGDHNTEEIFLQDHCQEFAEQLTLISFDLFRAIRPTEFLRKAWTRKDKHVTAPNIAELIIFMESVTVWAKFEIAVQIKEHRRKTIERICRIGIELFELGNQYGAVQIYLSLISSDLSYFKNDLEILFENNDNNELSQFMNKIGKLIDHSKNHSELRNNLWNLQSPAIPYLGVFLKDAFQADELLKISKLKKVNPKQMELLYNVYDRIELFRTGIPFSKKIQKNTIIIQYIHRQLHRSKKLNVRALTQFCKQQSIKERNKKKSLWGR